MKRPRRNHAPAFKAKVALAAWFTYDGLDRLTSTRLYTAAESGLLPVDATLTAPAWDLTT